MHKKYVSTDIRFNRQNGYMPQQTQRFNPNRRQSIEFRYNQVFRLNIRHFSSSLREPNEQTLFNLYCGLFEDVSSLASLRYWHCSDGILLETLKVLRSEKILSPLSKTALQGCPEWVLCIIASVPSTLNVTTDECYQHSTCTVVP